jgi:hypothetical protein
MAIEKSKSVYYKSLSDNEPIFIRVKRHQFASNIPSKYIKSLKEH